MLYSNESEISQDLGSNESQTVIKQKTFLQAVQKKSNLQSNKKLSPLSFNQREDNNFLFNFPFNLQHSPLDVLETMTINSSQFLWFSLFHSHVINFSVIKNIEQKLKLKFISVLFSQQNTAQRAATERTMMTDADCKGITCVPDVDILIGCRDSVGESHVRRVKCVATVNNTRVVTGDRLVFYPG